MHDMTPTVLETCKRITGLCNGIEAQLTAYLDTTDVRPEISVELLLVLNLTNRMLAKNLRRATDFEHDGWLKEKLDSAKHSAEILTFWFLSEPADWYPPEGIPARRFAHDEMMACLGAVKDRAEGIAAHISKVGAVSELDRVREDANDTPKH